MKIGAHLGAGVFLQLERLQVLSIKIYFLHFSVKPRPQFYFCYKYSYLTVRFQTEYELGWPSRLPNHFPSSGNRFS